MSKLNGSTSPENGNQLGNQTPAVLLAEERQRLRPLKVSAETLALRVPVVVGPRAAVMYDGQAYAMPPDAVGLVGALYLYPDRVVVVAGRYQATHARFQSGRPNEGLPTAGIPQARSVDARTGGISTPARP